MFWFTLTYEYALRVRFDLKRIIDFPPLQWKVQNDAFSFFEVFVRGPGGEFFCISIMSINLYE